MDIFKQKSLDDFVSRTLLEIDAEIINQNGEFPGPIQKKLPGIFSSCTVKEKMFGKVSIDGEGVKIGNEVIRILPKGLYGKLVPIYEKEENLSYSEKQSIKVFGYHGTIEIEIQPSTEYIRQRFMECTQDDQFKSRLSFHESEIIRMAEKVKNRFANYSHQTIGLNSKGLFLDMGDCTEEILSFSDFGLMNLEKISQRVIFTKAVLNVLNKQNSPYSFSVRIFGWSAPYSLIPYFLYHQSSVERKVKPW